jgi:hypothetical protein
MRYQEPRARAAGLPPQAPSMAGAGGAGGDLSIADAKDAWDAVQGLREACHDMRQPVAGVLVLADAALTDPGLPRPVRVCLEQIVQQAEWLADMIQDWLHSARPSDQRRYGQDRR